VPASRPFINPTTRAHVHSLAAAGPVVITRHSPRRQLVHWPPTNDPPSACPRGHHETAVRTEPPATVAQSSRRQQNGTHLDVSISLGGEPSGWRRGCTTVDDDDVPLPTPHSLLRSLGTNGYPNGRMLGFSAAEAWRHVPNMSLWACTPIRQTFTLTKHNTFHYRNIDMLYDCIDNTVEEGEYRSNTKAFMTALACPKLECLLGLGSFVCRQSRIWRYGLKLLCYR
jgi:hypothetical protein